MSIKTDVIENFPKLTSKHMCQKLFFNKALVLSHAALLKKRLWYRRFSVKFAKFSRTLFLQNNSGRLLPWKEDVVLVTSRWIFNLKPWMSLFFKWKAIKNKKFPYFWFAQSVNCETKFKHESISDKLEFNSNCKL